MSEKTSKRRLFRIRPYLCRVKMSISSDIKDKTASLKELVELRLAARGGSVRAQYLLGVKLGTAENGPKEVAEAVKWYRKAAQQDFAPAQNNLGLLLAGKRLESPQLEEAVKWFRRAAQQGMAAGQWNLARHLWLGEGVVGD